MKEFLTAVVMVVIIVLMAYGLELTERKFKSALPKKHYSTSPDSLRDRLNACEGTFSSRKIEDRPPIWEYSCEVMEREND